jgi:hypothetical protein
VVEEAGVTGENHQPWASNGKLYHLRLRVECTPFCNLQSRVRTHAVLVIGLYELLGNPTTLLIEPPEPSVASDLLVTILSIYVIFKRVISKVWML